MAVKNLRLGYLIMNKDSLDFYNKWGEQYLELTFTEEEMRKAYCLFLAHLPLKGRILDAGCGGGRDAKYFEKLGFSVTAFDASKKMVSMASILLKHKVLLMGFDEINFNSQFDGIWASRSLIHVSYNNLKKILAKLYKALKPQGIFYASFIYGETRRRVEGRTFYDMTELSILPFLSSYFDVIEVQIHTLSSSKELHILCRKKMDANSPSLP